MIWLWMGLNGVRMAPAVSTPSEVHAIGKSVMEEMFLPAVCVLNKGLVNEKHGG